MKSYYSPFIHRRLVIILIIQLSLLLPSGVWAGEAQKSSLGEDSIKGPFQPTWDSLSHYQCPEWFQDAKFGIWAHWGPQCVSEQGDWYARGLYENIDLDRNSGGKPNQYYTYHVEHYGHPSKFGFKDIINLWRGEHWEPEKLIALYKKAGAQYFVAMANHHDNFDNWDSAYQPWNSVKVGPKRDIIGDWAKAARAAGMNFGVSVHCARAWDWYAPAQGSDPTGPLAGVPYDGKLTKADGKGTWWDGLDPQDLYAQNHPANQRSPRWDPSHPETPDMRYITKFYHRMIDLIDKYHPDLIDFDDHGHPINETVGRYVAAHLYNSSIQVHGGTNEAIMTAKGLDDQRRKSIVLSIESGAADKLDAVPWQSEDCIGGWHYSRGKTGQNCYDRYKSAVWVTQTLADTVSKNGSFLLSVPVRADGTIDDRETAIVENVAAWMEINREAIFDTRPFTIFGEGPLLHNADKLAKDRAHERWKYSAADIRFTTTRATTVKPATLYAIAMEWPTDGKIFVKTLATGSPQYPGAVGKVELLGAKSPVIWQRSAEGLIVTVGTTRPCQGPCVLKITPKFN